MVRRSGEHAEKSGAEIPPPPLRLRIHKNAPPYDGQYRKVLERLEVVGRFRRLALDLPGVASAAAYADKAAADLGVKPVRVGSVTVSRLAWSGLVVWYWVSVETSTVYLLHAIPETLFGRIPASADHIAAMRGAEVQKRDAARAMGDAPRSPEPPAGRTADHSEPPAPDARGKPVRRATRRGQSKGQSKDQSQGDGS